MKNPKPKAPADREPPHPGDFWQSPTLEELTRIQGVKPINDVRELYGTWPGEPDDGFEEMIDRSRHPERYRDE